MSEVIHIVAADQVGATTALGGVLSSKGNPSYVILTQGFFQQSFYFVGPGVNRSPNMANGPNPEILGPHVYVLVIQI